MGCLGRLGLILFGLLILLSLMQQSREATLIVFILIVVWAAIIIWVFSDARARGANPLAWSLLVFVLNLIGLFIYLLLRPSGSLVRCAYCGRRRLAQYPRCNRCGN